MKINKLFLAAALALPSLAAAQTPPPAPTPAGTPAAAADVKQDIKKDVQDVRADREKLTDLNKAHADAIQDLNAKEKAAALAVQDNKSLTPAQRKAQLKDIRKDYNAQRRSINDKYKADKRALRADMRKDRGDIRKDRRELRQERHDMHRDVHAGKH